MKTQKILPNWIKKILSDAHSSMINIAVASFVLGGTVYLHVKSLWPVLTSTMQSPTPLWATIALVLLLGGYVKIKNQKSPSLTPVADKFENYQFDPLSGAWVHKDNKTKRVCAKCKIGNIFSPLHLSDNQKAFECSNCGKKTANNSNIIHC